MGNWKLVKSDGEAFHVNEKSDGTYDVYDNSGFGYSDGNKIGEGDSMKEALDEINSHTGEKIDSISDH